MKLYHGWYIVAASVLILALIVGTAIHAFGLFVLPVSQEFGLSRAEVNTGLILMNLGMAVAGPWMGRLLDRTSCRIVMGCSAVLLAASLVALAVSRSLWISGAVMAVPLAIAVIGSGTISSTTLVARWFTTNRGRALAIAAIGHSLGPVIVVPALSLLISAAGWRTTLIVVGVAIGGLLLAIAPFMREPAPGELEGADTAEAAAAPVAAEDRPALSPAQLMRLPQFWSVVLSTSFVLGIQQATLVSLVPLAQGRGLSLTQGATLLSVFGATGLIGKLLLAWRADRIDRVGYMAIVFALIAAISASQLFIGGYAGLVACSGFLGLAAGTTMPVFLALLAERFGAASFGTSYGIASLIATVICAAGVRYGGEVFDRTGSYDFMFLSFAAIGCAAALAMLATRRLPSPPRHDRA